METKFNFNSAICTSLEQSRRLLELGLKKETADMYYEMKAEGELPRIMPHKTDMDYFNLWDSIIPAWSLHRLIEMIDDSYEHYNWLGFIVEDDYDNMIQCIEFLIDDNRFNKEYLD